MSIKMGDISVEKFENFTMETTLEMKNTTPEKKILLHSRLDIAEEKNQ